ncbi:hypothetical protein C0Q70_07657 [Pomacea canaliculata]|uniref:Metalloendopeptidase n=1 Tax=Pomacea canaliculata TaxID=400727 RepID=A0A2T7PFM5_POMCA|nr:hypothetical protein C0Q70_07657 [Pomacea canaliculata]
MRSQRCQVSILLLLMLCIYSSLTGPEHLEHNGSTKATLGEAYDIQRDLGGIPRHSEDGKRLNPDHIARRLKQSLGSLAVRLQELQKLHPKKKFEVPGEMSDSLAKLTHVHRKTTEHGMESGSDVAVSESPSERPVIDTDVVPEGKTSIQRDGATVLEKMSAVAESRTSASQHGDRTLEHKESVPEHGDRTLDRWTHSGVGKVEHPFEQGSANSDREDRKEKMLSMKNQSSRPLISQTKKEDMKVEVTGNVFRDDGEQGIPGSRLLFQGDVMLSRSRAAELMHAQVEEETRTGGHSSRRRRFKRKVTYLPSKRWTLPIPYMFDTSEKFSLNETEKSMVLKAMRHLEDLTCITFREVNASDPLSPILDFKKDQGCWSYVGKERGLQLQELGTLLHELGHAIGFWHEHSRPDRQGFVRVHLEHVRKGEEFNFNVESWGELDNLDVPYDVSSIMHYGSTVSPCSSTPTPPGRSENVCVRVAPWERCASTRVTRTPRRATDVGVRWDCRVGTANMRPPIKTKPGMQLVLTVSPQSFMTHTDCSPYPTAVCTDYLEVKYNVSFGYTGARYCCGLPPSAPLRSATNALLVLFRTRQSGSGGFQASVAAEPCGGCHPGTTPQPPCRKSAQTECVKKWNSSQYIACPSPYLGTDSGDCNKWVTKEKTRLGVCTSEVDTCCDGFQVVDGVCRAPSNISNTNTIEESIAMAVADKETTSNDINRDADSSWSSWSPWQQCTRSCGGCGTQTRTRTCDKPTQCGGRSTDSESRQCNTFPCPNTQLYVCSITDVKEYLCGWTSKCYQQVKKYARCYTNCCLDFVEVEGKCIPKPK